MDYTTYALERIQYPCDIVSTAPWVVKSCDMIPGSSSYSTRVFIYGFEKLIVGDTAVIQVPRLKIKDNSEDDTISIKFEILEETEGDLDEWVTVYKHT